MIVNFLLFSKKVRPYLFSDLKLFVDKTASIMIGEALCWTLAVFSFAEGDAGVQMGVAYSRIGLATEIYVFRVFDFYSLEA